MKSEPRRQNGLVAICRKYYGKLTTLLSDRTYNYFIKLFLFILLYKAGEYVFNYLEKRDTLADLFDRLYYPLSYFITGISVRVYSLFYSGVGSDASFFISINHVKTIQMQHGCTGLMQLFQVFFILVFFPLSLKRKIIFLPVSLLIIIFASVLHSLILVPVAYSFNDHFTIFHNVISRVIFYTFFFINFLLWNNSFKKP